MGIKCVLEGHDFLDLKVWDGKVWRTGRECKSCGWQNILIENNWKGTDFRKLTPMENKTWTLVHSMPAYVDIYAPYDQKTPFATALAGAAPGSFHWDRRPKAELPEHVYEALVARLKLVGEADHRRRDAMCDGKPIEIQPINEDAMADAKTIHRNPAAKKRYVEEIRKEQGEKYLAQVLEYLGKMK